MRDELEGGYKIWGLLNCLGVLCVGGAALGLSVERCVQFCPTTIISITSSAYLSAVGLGMAAGLFAVVTSIMAAIHFCACSTSSCFRVIVVVFFFVSCALAGASGAVYATSLLFDTMTVVALSLQFVLHVLCALTAFFSIFA